MSHRSDEDIIARTHNTARYFVENRQVGWVLLVVVAALGAVGYLGMPKRKDPLIAVRAAVAVTPWPGAPAEKVEQLITRKIEEAVATNVDVDKIESTSRAGVSVVYVTLRDDTPDSARAKAFDDIDFKLKAIVLPEGARPIDFQKDFGDTAALMLTVASPPVGEVEIAVRARDLERAVTAVRAGATGARTAIVVSFPASIPPAPVRRVVDLLSDDLTSRGDLADARRFDGAGFVGVDGRTALDEPALAERVRTFARERLRSDALHPDAWQPVLITDPSRARERLAAAAGDAYSYRQLDDYTDALAKRFKTLPEVAKVTRAGVLAERVFLDYSQERLAALGLSVGMLQQALAARNVRLPGGVAEANGRNVILDAQGELGSERDIGGIQLGTSAQGAPVYLRDVMDVTRDYDTPARYVNFHTWRGPDGQFHRTRAVTVAVQMREGEQIARFGKKVDGVLAEMRATLPADLVVSRTSDQPRQVEEKVGLFMTSLYEAVAIIVLIGFIGFWEWRSAVLLSLSIPLTLAMTFGLMRLFGLDIQQMSIAALTISLGLLVDDPVVAGDAIKRELDDGKPRDVAAWLGPTKLARAILFATITNIVAYVPFLITSGDTGRFIVSLPIVLAASLVSSRLVSMTFIPLLGRALLRAGKAPAPRRRRGFGAWYARLVGWAIDHRYKVLAASLMVLVAGAVAQRQLKSAFFPTDLSYLSYVDMYLPEDATLAATEEAAALADRVIRDTADEYGRGHARHGEPRRVLRSVTAFVGGGGPRFWFSVSPQQQQLNYAQLLIEVEDNHDTRALIAPLQAALSARVPGARIDVRQLQTGKPIVNPVEVRISGDDVGTLRRAAAAAAAVYRAIPIAERTRDDWGVESPRLVLAVDADRANLAGVTHRDVATSSSLGFSGQPLGLLRDDDKLIPIVARLESPERATLERVNALYVLSGQSTAKVPLQQLSDVRLTWGPEKMMRRNQLRTITVSSFPRPGILPTQVEKAAAPGLAALAASLPPGYHMEVGGTDEQVRRVAGESAMIAVISVLAIFLALVVQFRSAVKPVIVLAAIPYGGAGAFIALAAMGAPFGFTAILGTISLIGVIVSHLIVLFDSIEELRERGEPLRDALIDAGLLRLRPVLITVGATVFGLVPLAVHGGPLWEALCYSQIGGLLLATFITLLLVPVLYAVFVRDLKWVAWGAAEAPGRTQPPLRQAELSIVP
ncbi:MAG TPA: efflux RND transporter permease subunit [Haliangiales bacterium]|nr:efflux RND transporter permease subunit [Haliangiales bacterium]